MFEFLLAAALIQGPKGEPDPAVVAVLRPQIIAIALDAEILDPREKGFVLSMDVLGDLEMIRGRWDTFREVPPLADHLRFADRKLTTELLGINRAWRQRMTDRLADDLVHAEEIRAVIADLDRRYEVWDCVRDSHCDYYYVTVRRQSLARLRELIGDEAYFSGHLPSVIP